MSSEEKKARQHASTLETKSAEPGKKYNGDYTGYFYNTLEYLKRENQSLKDDLVKLKMALWKQIQFIPED